MKTVLENFQQINAELILSAAYVKAKADCKEVLISAYSDNGTLIAKRECNYRNGCSKEQIINVECEGIDNIVIKGDDESFLKEINRIIKILIGE